MSFEDRVTPSTFTVTLGSGTVTDVGSLPWAIDQAKNNAGADTIDFSGAGNSVTLSAEVAIADADNLTITGNGSGTTSISNPTGRAFNISSASAITVTIKNMTFSGCINPTGNGGAILVQDEILSLENVVFNGNKVTATTGKGGAISVAANGGNLTVNGCTFSSNEGKSGGGALHFGPASGSMTATVNISNSTFSANTAGSAGGGAWLGNTSTTMTGTVVDSSFTGNISASSGGAISYSTTSTVFLMTFTRCNLNNNTAASFGGGAFAASGAGVNVTFNDCTISDNKITSGPGGGFFISAGTLTLNNCAVINNTATIVGGGIRVTTGNLIVNNSTISGNTAGVAPTGPGTGGTGSGGGGIYLTTGSATISFSTITKNNSPTFGSLNTGGGGIRKTSATGTLLLRNTVVAQNTTVNNGADITFNSLTGGGPLAVTGTNVFLGVMDAGSFTTTGITNLMGGTAANPGDARLLPLALNGGTTLNHLPQGNSPLRDVGDNSITPPAFDQRGGTRVVNGTIDIGAVEINDPAPFGNLSAQAPITLKGSTQNTFTVVYRDIGGLIDSASIGTSDVQLLDPNNNVIPITSFSANPMVDAGSVTVTYTFNVPGGSWDGFDNGNYTIKMNSAEVYDKDGIPGPYEVPASTLGAFRVGVADAFVVTTNNDVVNPADGVLSLREALSFANFATTIPDTITFDTALNNSTIKLGGTELEITAPVVIQGNVGGNIAISGDLLTRIVQFKIVGAGAMSTFSDLAFIDGKVTFGGPVSDGGAIRLNDDALTLNNVKLIGNTATGNGGGAIAAGSGVLKVNNSTFTSNVAGVTGGGAISAAGLASITITASTISGNTASSSGGGIYVSLAGTQLTVIDSTINNNIANGASSAQGGGIRGGLATVTVVNCTISGNSLPSANTSSFGAGISMGNGVLKVYNSTITNNTLPTGTGSGTTLNGGAGIGFNNAGTQITLESTIVAQNNNVNHPDLYSTVTATVNVTADNSLIGALTDADITVIGANNQTGVLATPIDAKLTPLGNFGGPTQTHGLLFGSPAVDKGSNSKMLATDQRGVARPVNPALTDIGSFEGELKVPQAAATLPNTTGGTIYVATVVYTDETGIDVVSIDLNDVKLSGKGFASAVNPISFMTSGTGTKVTATYTFKASDDGTWDAADNGTYTLTMIANQVFDTDSTPSAVQPGSLGTFQVLVPTTYIVDSAADEDDMDYTAGDFTLREALRRAKDEHPGATDVIQFAAALNGSTITLSLGELNVTDPISIQGNVGGNITISGNEAGRVINFNIAGVGSESTISNLTLTKGKVTGNGGAVEQNDDALTLIGVTITASQATGQGGAIHQNGGNSSTILKLIDCTIAGNTSTSDSGGGVGGSNSGGTVEIIRTTFSGNTSFNAGGGIHQGFGLVKVTDSTFANNTSTSTGPFGGGGGISVFLANLSIVNSTITGNSTGRRGGGVWVNRNAFPTLISISNSTITGNSATGEGGGGVAVFNYGTNFVPVTISSTIVSQNNNADYPDVYSGGTFLEIAGNDNLFGVPFSPGLFYSGTYIQGKAMLGPLGNYGGPTPTHPLNVLSLALNAGGNPLNLPNDQRGAGFARSIGQTDIGAFEGISLIPHAFPTLDDIFGPTPEYTFQVIYTDDVGINLATLGNDDLQVSGPGFPMPVNATYVSNSGPGQAVTVTYKIDGPPPSGWDVFDNGAYTITQLPNSVSDGTNFVPGGVLGTFRCAIGSEFIVDNLGDLDDGDFSAGQFTLREAINRTNLPLGTPDTISFAPGLTGTIALGSVLSILEPLNINGPGVSKLTINGGSVDRIFTINVPGSNNTIAITGLTLTNGKTTGNGGAINLTDDDLILTGVVLSNNSASSGGAVSVTTGSIQIVDSLLAGNTATNIGGAVNLSSSGSAFIATSTFSNNTANSTTEGGGALSMVNGVVSINSSTLAGNTATAGTGIGGAILITGGGNLSLNSVTLAKNSAALAGGGIAFTSTTSSAAATVNNSIVADNVGGSTPDLFNSATITVTVDANYSLIGLASDPDIVVIGSNNQIGSGTPINPNLAPLGNYGGPTPTMPPLTGSPVIDAGNNILGSTLDQRGLTRTIDIATIVNQGDGTDIGAAELQALAPPTVTVKIDNGTGQRSLVRNITVTFSETVMFPFGIAAAFDVSRVSNGTPGSVMLGFMQSGLDVVITFTPGGIVGVDPGNSLQDGGYKLTIFADKLQGQGGTLDGNNNGIAEGNPADNAIVAFHRLFGDANGDRTVNAVDFATFRGAFGLSGPSIFDFNNDNQTNATDFAQFRARFGITLTP